VPVEPLDGPLAADEPEVGLELAPDDAPVDEDPPVVVDVLVVLDVVDVLGVAGWFAAAVAVGTVSAGAPDVSVVGEPPPHAAKPAHARTAAKAPAMRLREPPADAATRRDTAGGSDVERLHAPAAVRAVVEVLLTELVAPVAEAKVLDRPRQLRWGRRERQELSDDLEGLAGLSIDVLQSRLGLDHDLPPSGWRPHPVLLTRPHRWPS
jgi:hypothetical protein